MKYQVQGLAWRCNYKKKMLFLKISILSPKSNWLSFHNCYLWCEVLINSHHILTMSTGINSMTHYLSDIWHLMFYNWMTNCMRRFLFIRISLKWKNERGKWSAVTYKCVFRQHSLRLSEMFECIIVLLGWQSLCFLVLFICFNEASQGAFSDAATETVLVKLN